MSKNKLIIAAAGAGKTTYLVNEAFARNGNILILTYIRLNKDVIKRQFYQKHGCIPNNVTVQTWFSFLLQHGVKPYQGGLDDSLFEKDIRGMCFVNKQSGLRYRGKKGPVYWKEEEYLHKFYFNKNSKIYSDKISKFVYRCNKKTDGAVIDRLARIYDHIFIDEVQDLAGYDLKLIKMLFSSTISVLLVGDPRQTPYATHFEKKYAKYRNGKIHEFIKNELGKRILYEIDTTTLNVSYRCSQPICKFSSKLYPDLPETLSHSSGKEHGKDHQGVYLIKKKYLSKYLETYKPTQLRWDRDIEVFSSYKVMNFGEAKGETFERVLIYPTKDMTKWIKDNFTELSDGARAKFYVALTRARYSATIVIEDDDDYDYPEIQKWK